MAASSADGAIKRQLTVFRRFPFPNTSELPLLQSAGTWRWSPFDKTLCDFWIGDDDEGHRWLVKMRGAFYALRERAFSVVAQSLGIACQSSTFLNLSPHSEPAIHSPEAMLEQAAIRLIPEHNSECCGKGCPLLSLSIALENANDEFLVLKESKLGNVVDVARGEFLGYICDQMEPPGRLSVVI